MSRRLKSLLFSTLYPSSVRPGHGIFVETRLRELMQHAPIDARVLAPVPWFPSGHARYGAYGVMARTPRAERWNGIDVSHPRFALLPKLGMTISPLTLAWGALPEARRLIQQGFDFDLIDAHYFYPDGVAAAWLARWLGKPLVITARGSDLNLIAQYAAPRRWMQWAAQQAQACIGVSAALVEVLRGWGLPEHKMHVMRNGVDLTRFQSVDAHLARQTIGLGDGGPVLLMVGNLVELKGHALVIDALPELLRQFPQLRLLIVGDGPERARLEAQIARLGLTDCVRLAGAVPNTELLHWYSAADALVLASSREGWPNVLLEAMACGTPVVATRCGGVPEIVTHDALGQMLQRRDVPALVTAIAAQLGRTTDRSSVRRHAQGQGWQATSAAQMRVFEAAASSSQRGH